MKRGLQAVRRVVRGVAMVAFVAIAPAAAPAATDVDEALRLLDELLAERLISEALHARRREGLLSLAGERGGAYRDGRGASDPEAVADGHVRRVALLVGNERYRHVDPLETAVDDVEAIADVLNRRFGFDAVLLRDATRAETLGTLDGFRRRLDADDHFLLYYAGHGVVDEASGRGYWLPVDAAPDDPVNRISSVEITDFLRALPARHALVVADSCFSGALPAAASPVSAYEAGPSLARSRTLITSGGLEPVLDSGFGEHSVFAGALLAALRSADADATLASVFDRVRRAVRAQAEQTPRHAPLRDAGHTGGTFPLLGGA